MGRHPQHQGGVWPLNVEYPPSPIITVQAQHPDDEAELKAQAEAAAAAVATPVADAEPSGASKKASKK